MSKINVAGLAESDGVIFKTRPAGQYPATISSVEQTETGADSKHPGSPMLKLQFKLPPFEELDGCQLYHYMILPNPDWMDAEQMRKKAAEIKRLCTAIGLDTNLDELDTDDLFQQELLVVVSEDAPKEGPYKGVKQNRITDFLSL